MTNTKITITDILDNEYEWEDAEVEEVDGRVYVKQEKKTVATFNFRNVIVIEVEA